MNVKHIFVCLVEAIDNNKKFVQISENSFDGEQFFEDIFPGDDFSGDDFSGDVFSGDYFPMLSAAKTL